MQHMIFGKLKNNNVNIIHSKYKLLYSILLALLVIVGVGCDGPEPPIDSEGEVVFSIDGTIEGNPLLIEAGREDVYLFTSYALNNDDIYEFTTNFEKTTQCLTGCNEALSISLLNTQVGIGFDLGSAVYLGDYPLATSEVDSTLAFEVAFQTIATGSSTIFPKWNFGDGTTANDLSPTHIFTTPNALVKLKVQDLLGQESSVQSSIDFGTGTECQKDFYGSFNIITGFYEFRLTEIQGLNPSTTYNWSLTSSNDSSSGFGSSFQTSVQANDLFEVCLDVNENGCVSQICKTYSNQTKTLITAATFETSITPTFIKNIESTLSNVAISYTNESGQVFSTKNGAQTSQRYFKIVKITPFAKNENNQSTVMVEAEIKCTLYDNNGETLELESNQLIFAIAYPE